MSRYRNRNPRARKKQTRTIAAIVGTISILGIAWWLWSRPATDAGSQTESSGPRIAAASESKTSATSPDSRRSQESMSTQKPSPSSGNPPTANLSPDTTVKNPLVRDEPLRPRLAVNTPAQSDPSSGITTSSQAAPRPTVIAGAQELREPTTEQAKPPSTLLTPRTQLQPETRSSEAAQQTDLVPPRAQNAAQESTSSRASSTEEAVATRDRLNERLARTSSDADARQLRQELSKLAQETIFDKKIFKDDRYAPEYRIASGDYLEKIGRQFDVPYEILMRVNKISSPKRIRAGQRIKALQGPFHAKIYKSRFRLDLYLQDLYVGSYQVGLGTDSGTPTGDWIVEERLSDPTYFPPESAENRRVIPGGDPDNPLGRRWLGLKGISGDALDQEGFGIHGTIDPSSIGQAKSLGCVRMHNDEVALVYDLLMPGKSKVTILP